MTLPDADTIRRREKLNAVGFYRPAKLTVVHQHPPVGLVAKPAKAAPAPKTPVSKKAAAAKRPPGDKRPPAELAKLTERLNDYIKSNPGQRMEAIGKALGTATRDLAFPVKKLLSAKKIRTEGEKRATTYSPA